MEISDEILSKIKEALALQASNYVSIIKQEYSNIMPAECLAYLNGIQDYKTIIKIEQTNTISMFVKNGIMYFPINGIIIINCLKKIPGYGVNKNYKTYTNESIILNNNNYLDYIIHVFLAGLTPLQFYEETLLHETTHLCGIGGATALREGFAELKTRELALKHNLKTSACGYPKEVKIAFELQSIFGKEIGDKISFARNNNEIISLLESIYGREASLFYISVENEMQTTFAPYFLKKYSGIIGPLQKTSEYEKIDYHAVYEIINNYKNKMKYEHIK